MRVKAWRGKLDTGKVKQGLSSRPDDTDGWGLEKLGKFKIPIWVNILFWSF